LFLNVIQCHYAEYRYAGCRNSDCRGAILRPKRFILTLFPSRFVSFENKIHHYIVAVVNTQPSNVA
jgi:hypothetical protein